MRTWNYGDVRSKVQKDLDLDEETFIQADEMVEYANEAIREAEAEILTLYEDYLLAEQTLSMVSGTSDYSLPTNIYADKIRAVIYRSGSVVYEVFPFRKLKKFLNIEMTRVFGTSEDYRYFIKTDSATAGYKMVLIPAARETSSTAINIFYIRNANRVPTVASGSQAASDATIIDIPEFMTFVIQYIKCRIFEKSMDPRYESSLQILQHEREMMTSTLEKMVVDDNDTVDMDLTHYREHS